MSLSCRDLHRTFQTSSQSIQVLKGIDLEVGAGEVVAILGPSGSGKSTLLNLLAGLDKPSEGEIFWDGEAIGAKTSHELAALRLKKVGLIFQDHYLLEDLNVIENVSLSGRLRRTVDKERVTALLGAVGLGQRSDFMPKKLSGGERQRVAVARALYAKPSIILADEPTGSLDRVNARAVYEILVDLARSENSAVVMVTHDEGLVKNVDKRFYLEDGRLQEQHPVL
ncbi:MAG: ABC transporter ATP-binding protein [Trueperaceae bacterium]|nr:ABC transporter ATP-binding protein [Trueperaceae bacterium]